MARSGNWPGHFKFMSLRDEMETDYAEMVEDDSTTMFLGEIEIKGRKSASVPTNEQMLDAGYNPRANCDFFVLQSELTLKGAAPAERDKLIEGNNTWTIKGIDDRKDALGFVYSLKKLA